MVCATAPDTYHESCAYISSITGRPYFGSPTNIGSEPPIFRGPVVPMPMPAPGGGAEGAMGRDGVVALDAAIDCAFPDVKGNCDTGPAGSTNQALSLGFPRDTFWPKSAAAFVGLGVVLTLLAAQLVSPTRRLRISRPTFRRPQPPKAIEPDTPTAVENAS